MKFYLTNAFSINMLERGGQDLSFVPVNKNAVCNLLRNEQVIPAIGHRDTAEIVSRILDTDHNLFNRTDVALMRGETSLIIAQYRGPRLPEGATVLPAGASIEFWQVYHAPRW